VRSDRTSNLISASASRSRRSAAARTASIILFREPGLKVHLGRLMVLSDDPERQDSLTPQPILEGREA
jgi:hypothetical protein